MKFTRLVLIGFLCSILVGCVPLKTKAPDMDLNLPMIVEGQPEEAERLVVMLPGLGDRMEHFQRHDFLEMGSSTQDDHVAFLATDAHFGYYRNFDLPNYFQRDILERWPDAKITLVGISMGGFGALTLARIFPEKVDEVILLAPYMGTPFFLRHRVDNGNFEPRPKDGPRKLLLLENWQFLEDNPYNHSFKLMVGRLDPFALALPIVRNHAPTVAIAKGRGGHNWKAWKKLWAQHLEENCW